jgi:hypothetical protein
MLVDKMLSSFYIIEPEEKEVFGDHWCGPDKYKYGEDTLIAKYPVTENTDGQSVEIYCCALPARFYKLHVLESLNSLDKIQPAYTISTGSSAWNIAALIAKNITNGMLEFEPYLK